ncbi:hypothetical protein EV424DRAFT_1352417 [Suillus variegatus]|nr:hypothetical protein EV424DRAFT_1352417 [Suillus variegatus]
MSSKLIALYPCSPNILRETSTKISASKDKVVYTNGKTVIIRDLENAALPMIFSGHAYNATVARFSPSAFYCASADITRTACHSLRLLWIALSNYVRTQRSLQAWTVGSGVPNQQIGSAWSGISDLVPLSMSGDLNVFDLRTGDKPTRILQAPQKAITAASSNIFEYFLRWLVGGMLHTSLVSGMATPKSVAVTSGETVFVAGITSVEAIRNNQQVFGLKSSYAPSADKRVHAYTWNSDTLTEKLVLPESEGTITALEVSNGALIVQGNSDCHRVSGGF